MSREDKKCRNGNGVDGVVHLRRARQLVQQPRHPIHQKHTRPIGVVGKRIVGLVP